MSLIRLRFPVFRVKYLDKARVLNILVKTVLSKNNGVNDMIYFKKLSKIHVYNDDNNVDFKILLLVLNNTAGWNLYFKKLIIY